MLAARIHKRNARAVWQTRGKCYVHIGKPWDVPKPKDAELDPDELRLLIGEITSQIDSQVQKARQQAQKERTPSTSLEPKMVDFNRRLFK